MTSTILTAPVDLLRAMILASPAWATWCGDAAPTSAYLHTAPSDLRTPHAILTFGDAFARTRSAIGTPTFDQTTDLLLYFAQQAPDPDATDGDAIAALLTAVGAVMRDLECAPLNGGNGTLVIDGWSIHAGPLRIPPGNRDRDGDLTEITLSIQAHLRG